MKVNIPADSRTTRIVRKNACETLGDEVWTDESSLEYNQTVVRIRTPFAGVFARGLRADGSIVVSGQL